LNGTTWIIANPAAGRGSTQNALSRIREEFSSRGIARFEITTSPGDEERLTTRAIAAGARAVVAVGGDGTCARIANAILKSGKPCSLGVMPTGTGNDFAKTLGVVECSVSAIADLVQNSPSTSVDVGKVDEHYFVNSCGFGFDASVLEATQHVRLLKGDAVYIYSALAQLFAYRGIGISVDADAKAKKLLMLTVSNGRYLGGAFRIAPHASVTDGELDVGFFGDTSLIGRVRIFAGAFRGTHRGLPSVESRRVKNMTLRFSEPPMMEVDGELRQARSSTVNIECLPRALSVIAAPGYPL
jgi:diacylglycerol kinase (ATP)